MPLMKNDCWKPKKIQLIANSHFVLQEKSKKELLAGQEGENFKSAFQLRQNPDNSRLK